MSVKDKWYGSPSIVRVTEYESSIVGSYLEDRQPGLPSCLSIWAYSSVHCDPTRRSVKEDFPKRESAPDLRQHHTCTWMRVADLVPQPPSPQIVMETLSVVFSAISFSPCTCEKTRAVRSELLCVQNCRVYVSVAPEQGGLSR